MERNSFLLRYDVPQYMISTLQKLGKSVDR
jgi:hypothetical protein